MNSSHPAIDHPAYSAYRAQAYATEQAEAVSRISAEYENVVDNSLELAKHAVSEIVSLNSESEKFEAINIKQLLGSDIPRTPEDIPIFEHYYELTKDHERTGERIIWFGHAGLAAFNRIGCAKKIATELGNSKLWGDSARMQQLYDFELDALVQTKQIDPQANIHKIDPFNSSIQHPVTIRPVYHDMARQQPSAQYAIMRAREAVADIYLTGEPKVELFRATHWLIALRLVDPTIKLRLLGGVQLSHEAIQSGDGAYLPQYGEELFAAAYSSESTPSAFVPLVSRSLTLMRRPGTDI